MWGDEAGKRFFAGVDGQQYDIDILEWTSLEEIFGTNNRAYRVGEFSAGDQIYTDGGKGAGVFRAPSDTVPFTHRDNDGRLWIMQITPVTYPDAKLQLWMIYDRLAFRTHNRRLAGGGGHPRRLSHDLADHLRRP